MDWVRHDLRHAVRSLLRRPGWSALAILALAIGLGVNTVAFSAVNALLYKPFRFANADRAGWLFVGTRQNPLDGVSVEVFDALARGSRTLSVVAADARTPLAYTHGFTEEIWAQLVSAHYFSIVGVQPLVGRALGASDDAGGGVPVLVSERFWRRRLGASRDLGRLTIEINRQTAGVVGVLPDEFQGPGGVFEPDVWVPLAARRTLNLPARFESRDARWLTLIAQPAAGIAIEAVRAEVASVTAGLVDVAPGDERRIRYERFVDRHPEARGLSPVADLGLAAVGIVLLVACFNVAGLMLARTLERRRDLAVHAALGASRVRLARLLLTEGLVLAAVSGAAALLLASWSASLLSAFSLPAPIPQRLHFVTDWRLVTFVLAVSALSALIPALAPMWQIARGDLARWSRVGGTALSGAFGHRSARRVFVVLQVAGSTLFLAVALLTVGALGDSLRLDSGFDEGRTAVLTIDPVHYGSTPEAALDTARAIAARVAAAPGVQAVTVVDRAPYSVGVAGRHRVSVDGRPCVDTPCTDVVAAYVDAEYFRVTTAGLRAGGAADVPASSDGLAVVVGQATADRLWPGQNSIGLQFKDDTDGVWLTVAGVASDTRPQLGRAQALQMYRPIDASHVRDGVAIIAVSQAPGGARGLLPTLRDGVRGVDASLAIQSLKTMTERMALPLWAPRTAIGFFGVCAILAVLLSTVGLFGATYYAVNQRRREFGVRSALGASARDVRWLVMGETARLAAPGLVLGALGAMGVVVAARATLSALPVSGGLPILAALAIQLAVAVLAAWSPAFRASRANPLDVLRAE